MTTKKLIVKRLFYCLNIPVLTLCLFIQPCSLQAQASQKYNVLFIAVDDMSDRCSFLGNPEVKTPNLQRLVNRGMVFKNAYTQYAMCNPSRTSLLTGWRPDKTHVYSNFQRPSSVMGTDVVYLPEYFHNNGYRTERYGKIMHGLYEDDCTWDYAEPFETGGDKKRRNSNELAPSSTLKGGDWWIIDVPDSTLSDGIEARNLVKRMQQPEQFPFFYGFGVHTHNPFNPSLPYWNLNGNPSVQVHLPINKSGTMSSFTGNGSGPIIIPETPVNDRNDVPSIAFPSAPIIKTNEEWKNTIHAYDGEVAQMDAQLGLVLDELDRQNLWDNTIVVFWSDHGQHLGEHEGTWLKNTVFEEALHVPLIVCVPGKPAGECSGLVELVDLYPTLSELCGLPAPQGMEGYSFAALLDNPTLPWKRAVFSQVKRSSTVMGRTIRTSQYRYTSWGTLGEELYDHVADPHEYTNLATNATYAAVLNNMRTILAEGWTKSLPYSCTLTATVNPAGTVNLCQGSSLVLSANTDSGVSYQWLRNGIAVNNAASQTLTVNKDGNYQVSETKGSSCTSVSATTIVNLTGKFQATITAMSSLDICATGSVVLKANAGSGFTYQWKKEGNIITGATTRFYTATAAGTYTVSVTDTSSCSKTSAGTIVTNSCGTLSSGSKNLLVQSAFTSGKLSVYPNPSKGTIAVTYNSSNSSSTRFTVYNATGKIVFSTTGTAVKGNNTVKLHLSNLQPGVYYLQLNDDAQGHTAFSIMK